MRPEIQALRGIAVLTVVVFHLWPEALPGGYVGVDVFFVISGFLITGVLVREVRATGRLSLAGFWARRARRILPAALVVLAFCALMTKAVVPETQWDQFFGEIAASTAYVENWHLAEAAVDYQALDDAASPVRHFWSLSVEEQFYVVWPVLILLALLAGRRWIPYALGGVTLASFAWSLHKTGADPQAAYFVTPTRAWEFGAGGLLALVPQRPASRTLSAAGLAAILVASAAFDGETAFPGVAALLPVLGAAAVIAGGSRAAVAGPARGRLRAAIRRGRAARPLERLGDISYSVYLWHWPLIVLWPAASRFALLGVTLVAAQLSKVVVHDPIRRVRLTPRWTLVPAAAATAAVMLLATSGGASLDQRVERDQIAMKRVLAKKPRCFGADAIARGCRPPAGVVPTPIVAQDAPNAPCGMLAIEDKIVPCAFGTHSGEQTRTFALIGDSHASHWRAALRPIARRERWRGISIARSHCPYAAGEPILPEPDRSGCVTWRREVPRWLARHPEVDTVVVAQFEGADADAPDFAAAWDALPASVRHVVVIRDTPQMLNGGATLACVDRAMEDHRPAGRACARSRDEALPPDPAAQAARSVSRASVVDMTRFFCDARACSPVIGGALVYKDANHITSVYGASLAPYLRRAILRAVPPPT